MKTAIPVALLCAALASCSVIERRGNADLEARAAEAYRLGRSHHLAQHPQAARTAYLAALQALPSHAAARNGLATLHAEHGELAEAIAIWRELTAAPRLGEGAQRAYLFTNLCRAHLLTREYAAALAALEKACLLDPLSDRSWQLLGETLHALGQEERAGRTLIQAASLRQHDLRADIAATGTLVAAARTQPAAAEHPDWDRSYLHVRADGMMELRRTLAPLKEQPASTPGPLLTNVNAARLEIRNGNGVNGMARALARRIGAPDLQVTRLSNAPGFAVHRTRIEYGSGYQDAARRLAQRLGNAELHEVQDCAPANLRLVLGYDLARKAG